VFKEINKIVIVGGGTSAWFSAAYLAHTMKGVEVTLVDKEVGTPVGVGEGTLLYFDKFLTECGFNTDDWFGEIDATFKSGILFPNWGDKKDLIWHPFYLNSENEKYDSSIYEAWTHHQHLDFHEMSAFYNISMDNYVDADNLHLYAYHVDCGKLVAWLQKQLENKITIIKSELVNINRDQDGYVSSIVLNDGQVIHGDLFIDCTGFKQILQEDPKRINLDGRLFCDTAIAGHVPYINEEGERHPYVVSEAVDHGWIWKIPVKTRIGSGLVFNRNITDVEEAKDYFCKHWNNRISKENLKVIDWTPYYLENPWQKNVVAIGLSGGFIEPLESTGLGTIISAIYGLQHRINAKYYTDDDIKIFNSLYVGMYEDCIDFINMHYAYHPPTSPFWKWVKETRKESDLIHWYRRHIETGERYANNGKNYFFGGANWYCWMLQSDEIINPSKGIDKENALKVIDSWEKHSKNSSNYVHHTDTLNSYHVYLKHKKRDLNT
jgi:tryptophan halogenase